MSDVTGAASDQPTTRSTHAPRFPAWLQGLLPDGVSPISLVFSALVAWLSTFTTNSVVAQQAGIVIAIIAFAGTQALWIMWQRRNPASLQVAPERHSVVFQKLRPYAGPRGTAAVPTGHLPERDRDCDKLLDTITGDGFRLGVLHGETGAGKTSLIQAEVWPRLEGLGWSVWHVPRLDPQPARAVSEAAELARGDGLESAPDWPSLNDVLAAAGQAQPGRVRGLVIVIDGVDRLYRGYLDPADRPAVWRWVASMIRPRVRVLLCVRSEQLRELLVELKEASPSLNQVPQYQLQSFDADAARRVLITLAERSGLGLEKRLPRRVAGDLLDDQRVCSAEVQLLAEILFDKDILSFPAYVWKRRARGLLREYFRTWLAELKDRGIEPHQATNILGLLAEHDDLTLEQLHVGCPPQTLQSVLDELEAEALVERSGTASYRLVHPSMKPVFRRLAADSALPASRQKRMLAGLTRGFAAGSAWLWYWPRALAGPVALLMAGLAGVVVYLIVAGYPQGRQVDSVPILITGGAQPPDLVAFDLSGRYLAADIGTEIVVWDLQNQKRVVHEFSKLEAHIDRSIETTFLAFRGPDEVRLFGAHGEMWAWNITTGTLSRSFDQPILTGADDAACTPAAPTVNGAGTLFAEGTTCGRVHVMNVDERREVQTFDHFDPNCSSASMSFSRAENELLEFYRCKTNGDGLTLQYWPLTPSSPAAHSSNQPILGDLVKVLYGADGNPYVVTVTNQETDLWEMAHQLARARWPIAVYDGAPTDLAPDGRLLAVGFSSREGASVQLYERGQWPFDFVPVKDSARGVSNF